MNKLKEARKLRKKLDKEWADKIKERDKSCIICGSKKRLNAHHLIPREVKEFRYDLDNGVALCPKHHKYSYKISAHKNSIAFIKWMKINRPKQLKKVFKKINLEGD